MKQFLSVLAVASLMFTSCQKQSNETLKETGSAADLNVTEAMVGENGQNPDDAFSSVANRGYHSKSHVYLESNDEAQNVVLVYEQQQNGKLVQVDQTNSGGKGAGLGLGSEGAIAVDRKKGLLFAVNAGSNSVSSFRIKHDGKLQLLSTSSSRGERPISVTVHDQFVYAVNSLSADICGFKVDGEGKLCPIGSSCHGLSTKDAMPAQIAFTPDGNVLLVTEKGTNKITAFAVKTNGEIASRIVNNSVGTTPFGFDFARGKYMIVTNADGGNPNTSSCTSYKNIDGLYIHATNGKVPNGQSAVCWLATSANGRYAFTANTGSNTITAYYVDGMGKIYLMPWVHEKTGEKPADITVSSDNEYLYNINGGTNTLGEYKRWAAGNLQNIGYITAIPDFAAGLVSY